MGLFGVLLNMYKHFEKDAFGNTAHTRTLTRCQYHHQIRSDQSPSHVRLFATP